MSRTFAALILAVSATAAARSEDAGTETSANWHHWRGPDANGSAPKADPPTKWDATTNVKWKALLPGRGSASPIVWGNRVFVLTAIKTDRQAKPEEQPKPDPRFKTMTDPPTHFYKFVVFCFDRTTGKPLWEKVAAERVPHEGHHPSHSYAAGSPTTDGKYLYVSFGSFGNYCYDFDGNLIWSRELRRLNTRYGWGEAVTPVIHQGNLLLNYDQEADSALFCLEAATGKPKWVAERTEKSSWNTPLVVEYQGTTQVIVNGMTVVSYDLKDGKPLWSWEGGTVNPIPSPVRVGDAVVCMSGYKGSVAVSIPLGARGTLDPNAKVNWRYAKGTPYVPSPALVGDRLYFTEMNETLLTVLDAKTGKPVIDKERLPQAKSFYASPVAAAGRVYFVDRNGTTVVLRAGDALDVLAVNKLDDEIDATPAAVGKQLFLRGQKYLYCIEGK
jgi:outer membrane protein assembly factor BamB